MRGVGNVKRGVSDEGVKVYEPYSTPVTMWGDESGELVLSREQVPNYLDRVVIRPEVAATTSLGNPGVWRTNKLQMFNQRFKRPLSPYVAGVV